MSDQEVLKAKEQGPEVRLEGVETQAIRMPEADKEATAEKFDKQQEGLESIKYGPEEYKSLKEKMIEDIQHGRLNTIYNTIIKNEGYTDLIFRQEKTEKVREYLIAYNIKEMKNNAGKPIDQILLIDIDKFMVNFEEEKLKPERKSGSEPTEKIIAPLQNQEIGKFIDLPQNAQNEIKKKFSFFVQYNIPIGKVNLFGLADATSISEIGERQEGQSGEENCKAAFENFRSVLIIKGLDKKRLEKATDVNGNSITFSDNYFDGINELTHDQKQEKLNTIFAYNRALMQLVFLPAEQIQYINENITNMIISLDAKKIGEKEFIGDEFTGGKVETAGTGPEREEITEVKEYLLNKIAIKHVNFAFGNDSRGQGVPPTLDLYCVGGFGRGAKEQPGTVQNLYKNYNDINSENLINHSTRKHNGMQSFHPTKNEVSQNGNIILGPNATLWIILDPRTEEGVKKALSFQGEGMQETEFVNFDNALTEAKSKTTNTQLKSYINNIQILLNMFYSVNEIQSNIQKNISTPIEWHVSEKK